MKSKLVLLTVLSFLVAFVASVPLSPPVSNQDEPVTRQLLPYQRSEAGIFAPEDDFQTYRLPNNSRPVRYDLWLKTDVDKEEFDFDGRVKILINIIENTQTITLHARQLIIDKVDFLRVSDQVVLNANLVNVYNEFYEFVNITLPSVQVAGSQILLDITYRGNLRLDGSGFYRASYQNAAGNTVWFATTQFEMTDARHAMPCYDEPGIRAVTGLKIQHDRSYNAIANTPLVGPPEPIAPTNYVTSTFEDTPPMQSYLLAFIISDYSYVSNNNASLEQRVYAKPQAIAEGRADYAVEIVGPVLWKLEEVLKVKFPLKKMDHALIFDYIWGAMENFGLITYQERSMLYLKGVDDASREYGINTLVAHEYAHQWFGNIVNPSWWAYTWLNEGFATLFANYIPHLIFPEGGYMERFRTGAMATAFRVDVRSSVPLNYYVETPANIRGKFDSISYSKGGTYLRMIMETLTPPTFLKGLNYYLQEMYYSPATPQDLHRNLQRAYDEDFSAPLDLETIMNTWEDQAGYPIIHVEKFGSSLTFTQKRFDGGNQIYSVPISFATQSAPTFDVKTPKLWLSTASRTFSGIGAEEWVILNIQQTGYYKVSYGKNAWTALIRALSTNRLSIPTLHRMLLFSDIYQQLQDESVEPYQALELFEYLSKETETSPLSQSVNLENFISGKLFGAPFAAAYQQFIQSVIAPHIMRLGFDVVGGEPSTDATIRSWAKRLSCKTHQASCLNYEHNRLKAFMDTGSGSYSLCDGVRLADETLFGRVREQMLASTGTARNNTIDGLGCSLNRNFIMAHLLLAVDKTNSLSDADRQRIWENTAGTSEVALDTALDVVRSLYTNMEEALPGSIGKFLEKTVAFINIPKYFDKFVEIATNALDKGYLTQLKTDTMMSSVSLNLQWMSSHGANIEAWLPEVATDAPTTTPATTTSATTTPATTSIPGSTTSTPATTQTTGRPSDQTTTLGSSSLVASMTALVLCAVLKYFI